LLAPAVTWRRARQPIKKKRLNCKNERIPNLLAVALVRVVAFARLLQPLRGAGESGRGEHMVAILINVIQP
jgi:hypothetical protein